MDFVLAVQQDPVQDWLNVYVNLPVGYKTTRRDALKLGSLSLGLGALWVMLTRAKVGHRLTSQSSPSQAAAV